MTQWMRGILLLMVTLPVLTWADDQQRTWLDRQLHVVPDDSNKAMFYLDPPRKQGDLWAATLYFATPADNGEPITAWEMYLDGPDIAEANQVGEFTRYHRNNEIVQKGTRDGNGEFHGEVTFYKWDTYVVTDYRHGVRHGKHSIFYDNGQLNIQWDVVEGEIQDCVCPEYDEKGNLVRKHPYVDGERHGVLEEYKDGRLVSAVNYKRGELHGRARHFDEAGEVTSETFYVDRKKQGTKRTWSEGELTEETEYHDGERHGVSRQWQKGVLVEEANYANGTRVGEYRRFHDNGNLGFYQLLDDQGEVIEEKEYDEDGSLYTAMTVEETEYGPTRIKKTWNDDVLVRLNSASLDRKRILTEEYDASGELKGRSELLDGNWYGLRMTTNEYADSTHIEYEYYDKHGKLHGERRVVDENDEVVMLQTFDHGEHHGPYLRRQHGRIAEEGRYERGSKTGRWQEYSSESGATWSGTYVDGRRDGYWVARFEEGYDHFRGHYANGEPVGAHLLFALDGSLKEVRRYENGVLHGEQTFYSQGRVSFVWEYQNGRMVGE